MGCALVIDTSFGSTVGIVGHEPIIETDSRTHVERLRTNIAQATRQAGYTPDDIDTVIAGMGPAPFTGLRAGIVAAKAIAFATGARLVGHDILEPQARWNAIRRADAGTVIDPRTRILTLAVNDARRKQLYFALYDAPATYEGQQEAVSQAIIDMDIDYPESITERVNAAVQRLQQTTGQDTIVDVIGHGAGRYADVLNGIEQLGDITDESVLDQGKRGLFIFAADAEAAFTRKPDIPVEPLYLRRPDADVPAPLKHVLGHEGAERTA